MIEHGRSGFVIEPANEDALAAALEWCLDHQPEMLEMRRAARDAAATWTWQHFRQRVRGVLLGGNAGLQINSHDLTFQGM
jgi:glycosyltransferase involved in cell wall biosynthesis